MNLDKAIGFLGFGNMGQAIVQGLLGAKTVNANQLIAYDIDASKRAIAEKQGGRAADSLAVLCSGSDILLLATKPQDMAAALSDLATQLNPDTLIVSIAAGISTAFIQSHLGAATRVARVMPNTPALVSAGAAGIAFSATCSAEDKQAVITIFEAVGIAEVVSEESIDAVTALSGSGPAYFFYFVECMTNAAMELGLTNEQATHLATQTALGAGKMLVESGESAATLRERVTSKGGTTFAALEVFQAGGLEDIVTGAMKAAAERSRELGH